MKKYVFIALFAIINISAKAAFPPGTYTFSQFTAPYSSLTNGSIVIQGHFGSFTEYIGQCSYFTPWEFFGYSTTPTNAADINSERSVISIPIQNTPVDDVFRAYPLGVSLTLSITGPHIGIISCKVDGSWPNRIYKVQFDSVFTLEEAPTIESTVSYQAWFYENDHAIEFRFGPRDITPGHVFGVNGILCGICYHRVGSGTVVPLSLEGDPNNPTLTDHDFNLTAGLSGVPPENKVYRFAPAPLGVNNTINNNNFKVSFAQENNKAYISYSPETMPTGITLYNIAGQKLPVSCDISATKSVVNFAQISIGMYVLEIKSNEGTYRQKIVLQ